MPTYTKSAYKESMGLAKPLESDYWDPKVYNENFDKIDSYPFVVQSGTTTAKRTAINGTSETIAVTWYYKKWSDGTLEAYAVSHIDNWRCSDKQKQDGTWRSGYVRFRFPALGQSTIFHRSAYVSAADDGAVGYWVEDASNPKDGSDNANYSTVRIVSTSFEDTTNVTGKNVYLSFKGTWS